MRLRAIAVMVAIAVALGAVYLFVGSRGKHPRSKPRTYVWTVAMDQLQALTISIPPAGKAQAWVKHKDGYWYFDQPNGPKVDMRRWGGGIPLLLTGPEAKRTIVPKATEEQLQIFGLRKPSMVIHLGLTGGKVITIDVGDRTPDRQSYYVKLATSQEVYTLDYTWRDVIARLVLDPPYPPSDAGRS